MKLKLVGRPKNADYLTPGKVYAVLDTPGAIDPVIVDDEGDEIQICIRGTFHCPHARPAVWEVVE